MSEWHPYGNPNASGNPGEKSAHRAEALRSELKGMRERKEFTPEYWEKMGHLESMTPKAPETRCRAYISPNFSTGGTNNCVRAKGHEGPHSLHWAKAGK